MYESQYIATWQRILFNMRGFYRVEVHLYQLFHDLLITQILLPLLDLQAL